MAKKHHQHTLTRPRVAEGFKRWQSLRSEPLGSAAGHEVESISTARFALLVLGIATIFTLYIGHVYSTQDLLDALHQMRRENLRLHLQANQLRGELDKATGPSVIYEQAAVLGLEDGFAYAPLVRAQ